jgi:anaerobic selenocysteine-containing dehydrogenase
MTKIVWDNAALMSKKTADALGVQSGDMVRLHAGDNSIQIAAEEKNASTRNSAACTGLRAVMTRSAATKVMALKT